MCIRDRACGRAAPQRPPGARNARRSHPPAPWPQRAAQSARSEQRWRCAAAAAPPGRGRHWTGRWAGAARGWAQPRRAPHASECAPTQGSSGASS
eukprot:10075282-Alexandrium_andersonii.AAC.1